MVIVKNVPKSRVPCQNNMQFNFEQLLIKTNYSPQDDGENHYFFNRKTITHIVVKDDLSFRISTPLFSLFENQKKNKDSFAAFQDDFLGIASEHDVHRAFFG